jgi:anaerobic magnesium-protoporphyrin IX monomethyl ester cyclase
MHKSRNIKEVLLINPFQVTSSGYDFEAVRSGGQYAEPPLGLAYIAATLRERLSLEVNIYDANIEAIKQVCNSDINDMDSIVKMLRDRLSGYQPDLVGVSCLFHALYQWAHRTCEIVKAIFPECPVVMGGIYPTMSPQLVLADKNIDYIVFSEGEETLVALIQALKAGADLGGLDGIAYRNRDHIVIQEKKQYIEDLDSLPHPDRNLLPVPDYTKYARHFFNRFGDREKMVITTMTASRGCPFNCTFCATRLYWGSRIRYRSPQRVLEEMEFLMKKYGTTHFVFNDDNLAINGKIVSQLFDGIIERGWKIRWTAAGGLSVASLNRDIIEKMHKSGILGFNLGIESGCKATLKRIRKPVELKRTREVIRMIRGYDDTYIIGFFMIGFPFETQENIDETLEFARTLDLDWILFLSPQPYPGTSFYDDCVRQNYISANEFNFEDLTLHRTHFNTQNFDLRVMEDKLYLANLESNFLNSRNLKNGNLDQAIRDFQWVIEMVPDHAIAFHCLSKAYFKKGLKEAAEDALKKAADIVKKDKKWQRYCHDSGIDV